jgi:hypothetical protein
VEALHHIREVTHGENHSQIRTGNGTIAALRNAKALRHNARDACRPLTILGIIPP